MWSSLISESVGYRLLSPAINSTKKMMLFHKILPSNSGMKVHADNAFNHYVTVLSDYTELDGDLEVALSDMLSSHGRE